MTDAQTEARAIAQEICNRTGTLIGQDCIDLIATTLTTERAAHAEARKALDALDRMSRGVDWCDQDEQARRWSAARRALEGGE